MMMSVPPVFPPYEIVSPTPIAEIAAPSTAFDSKSLAINGSVIIDWNSPNNAELIAVQNMVLMAKRLPKVFAPIRISIALSTKLLMPTGQEVP